ncbi:MAG: hypothetical protein Q8P60_04285 [Pseudorhodobacter sp.]|nr:hypothetical protein [Pseudorhodobacter sp.]
MPAEPPQQPETSPETILAVLVPSFARRLAGAGVLAALAGLLLYLALWYPPAAMIWRLFLLGFGAGVAVLVLRLWQATAAPLELTSLELREHGGRCLALVCDMRSISRGVFAFKPSNGFLIRLARPGPRVWAPGLWWRLGRLLGVGGVTSGQAARNMADTITILLNQRR